jgi:hypothetical protein
MTRTTTNKSIEIGSAIVSQWTQSCGSVRYVVRHNGKTWILKTLPGAIAKAKQLTAT